MSRPSIRLAVTAAAVLLPSAACERPGGAAQAISRVPGEPDGLALSVPYPVSEPERIEGAGRQSLVRARFVHVSLGGPPEAEYGLPERITSDGPVLVAEHVGPESRAWQPLRRLAFGRVEPTPGRAMKVDAAEVEALGIERPATSVWLVGPRGTCRAQVGPPVVGAYEDLDALMVGFLLEDCPGRAWAQVGLIADAIAVDFRWVPAQTRVEQVSARSPDGKGPPDTLLPDPSWPFEEPPRFEVQQMREIPDVAPRVLQAHRAWMSSVPAPDDLRWCTVDATSTRADGWFNGRWIDAIPWTPEVVGPFMLGAFVNGTQVDAVIYDDRHDGLVVVPPGPLDDVDDPEAWTQRFVPTGPHGGEEGRSWGVYPARGLVPVGPACEPE
ncbi:MAG: hypothetical protein AB1Z98_15850 [Nannocystaceae bacterium]